jgi:hypothetical protein
MSASPVSDAREARAREIQRRLLIPRRDAGPGAPPVFADAHKMLARHYWWLKTSPQLMERRNVPKRLAAYDLSTYTIRSDAMIVSFEPYLAVHWDIRQPNFAVCVRHHNYH